MHTIRPASMKALTRLVAILGVAFSAEHAIAADYSVIYSFPQYTLSNPNFSHLVAGPAGAVYGYNDAHLIDVTGTVFKLQPPGAGRTSWTYSIVYNFHGNADHTGEGTQVSGLVLDKSGALYGTTSFGGATGDGTVFKLTPPAAGQANWTRTTLFDQFDYKVNGALPSGHLSIDSDGSLFGTTLGGAGKCSDCGTVYRLSPPTAAHGQWGFTVLHAFKPAESNSPAGVTIGPDGALYGAADTIWRLVRPVSGGTPWDLQILAFGTYAQAVGAGPGQPIFDRSLTLFGSTNVGGSTDPGERYGSGLVYRLTPPAAGQTGWTQTILYDFSGADGDRPVSALTEDRHGILYGVTSMGGTPPGGCGGPGCGTVFRLTSRDGGSGYPWNRITLHSFTGLPDGSFPDTSLLKTTLPDGRLALFGATYGGGVYGGGTIFRIIP